jgi:hypothetical protein
MTETAATGGRDGQRFLAAMPNGRFGVDRSSGTKLSDKDSSSSLWTPYL